VGPSRLRLVTKVLSQLFADEIGQAVGNRRRAPADIEEQERQRAHNVRLALERLGPFYIKVGQILSTRTDFVRPSLIAELKKLHGQISVSPFLDFEPVLADELGPDWKLRFMDVQTETPLGTASLAQVYQATLWDGTPAVVKIQRPGVQPIVLQDMALLRRAARLVAKAAPRFNAVIDVDAMLNVIFDAMEPELDFVAEARNMGQGSTAIQRLSTCRSRTCCWPPRVCSCRAWRRACPFGTRIRPRSQWNNGRPSVATCWRTYTAASLSTATPMPIRTREHFRISRGEGVADRLGHGGPGWTAGPACSWCSFC
jgi:hypothetical protein